MKFPFVRPEIPSIAEWQHLLEIPYARQYFTNFGELETRLSQELLNRFGGAEAAVTLAANATCGLTAALIAHEVRGRVVIPNFTFPATLDAVFAARCTPVLCDVDPTTLEMSPAEVARVCADFEISAVMPVRSYGFVRDFSPIIEVARSNGVPTIIDGAAALGAATIDVAPDVTEVLSLHATKSLGIGEGGAVFSHTARRHAVRSALNFGLRPDRHYGYGINGKMTELQAAVGLAQAPHAERLIAGRQAMAVWYDGVLQRFRGIEVPREPGPTAWSNYPVLLPGGADTEAFQDDCHRLGYQVRRYYWPTLAEGFTEEVEASARLDVSSDAADRAVCLPLYASATPSELAEIEEILCECLTRALHLEPSGEPVAH